MKGKGDKITNSFGVFPKENRIFAVSFPQKRIFHVFNDKVNK